MPVRPVILAEDNEALRRLYADLLESAGYTVMRAGDGEKAVALLHKVVSPHLIILDIMMPRMSGIEACIQMRKIQGPRTCPIVFLTALDEPRSILECLRAGGDDYMMKSAPLPEILERVRYWSRRGRLDNGEERRAKAIKALEAMAAEGGEGEADAAAEMTTDQIASNQLVAFIRQSAPTFDGDATTLYRFGFLVGLTEACAPAADQKPGSFAGFIRGLVERSGFIDCNEADTLLDNYEDILGESEFRAGWERGRGESADVGMPQLARLSARFDDLHRTT